MRRKHGLLFLLGTILILAVGCSAAPAAPLGTSDRATRIGVPAAAPTAAPAEEPTSG